jgi:hypothetical protein
MIKLCSASFLVLALAPAAYAQPDEPYDYGSTWYDPHLATGVGVGVTIGGGISGFTDQTMRNALSSDVVGLWDARVSVGTHVPLGIDVSYVGTAANVNAPRGGTLVGSVAEGALRLNLLPHDVWNPYLFAGIGWQRYDVTGMGSAPTLGAISVRGSENLVEYPMGVGISMRDESGWLVDARGTFRAEPSSSLVRDVTGVEASAHWWEASAAIGYEF